MSVLEAEIGKRFDTLIILPAFQSQFCLRTRVVTRPQAT
jgi:hypothetical protein